MFFLDRKQQKHDNYSGINGIAVQDLAITDSMGPIVDRSRENLGTGDVLVARLRRFLLKLARQIEAGETPPRSNGEDFPNIDTRMVIAPKSTTYEDVLKRRDWKWGEVASV
jgi:phthalate 4,5-dioxygenase oxygenase subunit